MHFFGILVLMIRDVSLGYAVPVDTVIVQVQQWGVVGAQQVMDQVLFNGVPLKGASQKVDHIIQTMSADAHLLNLISVKQTSLLKNHTLLRSRVCVLEGSQLHWTDRVFYDGKVYLTLDHTDTWTVLVPQALALKFLWDQEVQRTRTERISLQEGCIRLMKELRPSQEQSGRPFPLFVIPILALLLFAGLFIISILLFKKQGLRHPGGVIGSLIHYPKNMTEMAPEIKDSGSPTL